LKDSFLNFEYNCEKISLEAITVQKKKGGQGLIETQYRSFQNCENYIYARSFMLKFQIWLVFFSMRLFFSFV
jgi:hypothetical protein